MTGVQTCALPISDVDGKFPLSEGFNITEITGKLSPCPEDSDYITCENTIIIRFKAKIKVDTPKHFVIESSANIETYSSNQGVPLKLRLSTTDCVSSLDEINLDECGGIPFPCSEEEGCPDSEVQIDNDNEYNSDLDNETVSDFDDKASVNDSDTETDEKDNSSGCGCSILGDQ